MNTPNTILVVDDDVLITKMLRAGLGDEGYNVIVGYDGQMAYSLANIHAPDIIIMDVNMPRLDGLLTIEFLRKSERTRNIPIILLSGEQSSTIYPTIDGQQRVFFVKKPLDFEHISSILRELLQRYAPAA